MKIRRIELRQEEFLAGISGELTPAELGVYWMICLLQYSHNGQSIRYDMNWLRAKFRPTKANRQVEDIVKKLISMGKVYSEGEQIGVRRVAEEAEKGLRRISEAAENGRRGGRPRKEINGIDKGYAFGSEKLNSSTDSTDSTDSTVKKESPNGDSKEKRRFRLPENFERPPTWLDDAAQARKRHNLPEANLELQWERFFNWSQSGSPNAVKTDWKRAWVNWCMDAETRRTTQQGGLIPMHPGAGG